MSLKSYIYIHTWIERTAILMPKTYTIGFHYNTNITRYGTTSNNLDPVSKLRWSFQVWDFHYEDKTVMIPSNSCNGNPYTGKTTSSYWDGALWSDSQMPYMSPSWVGYGVSIVNISEKVDRVITRLQCIMLWTKVYISKYKSSTFVNHRFKAMGFTHIELNQSTKLCWQNSIEMYINELV